VASAAGIIVCLLVILVLQTAIGWLLFIDILVAIATLATIFIGQMNDKDQNRKHNWTRDLIALAVFGACLALAFINLT
jgi:hypothetical protein